MLRTIAPLRRAIAAALVAVAASAGAQPTVVDFNGLTDPSGLGIRPVANCYTEDGFVVTAVGVPCTGARAATAFAVASAIDPTLFPGSPALFLNDPVATLVEFTRVGGGLFSLSSISFAPFLQGATTVSLTGIRPSAANVFLMLPAIAAGGLIPALSTFTPMGFTDISALRITATNEFGEPLVLIDNATFNASVVPEPATIGLVAIGLLGVGAVARRRRAAA